MPVAGSQTVSPDLAGAGGTQHTAQRSRLGRAYRAGRLVCGWVHVTISVEERLGLTLQERRRVRLRFHEPLDDGLRSELAQLMRRRGRSACRAPSASTGSRSSSATPTVSPSASSGSSSRRRFITASCATWNSRCASWSQGDDREPAAPRGLREETMRQMTTSPPEGSHRDRRRAFSLAPAGKFDVVRTMTYSRSRTLAMRASGNRLDADNVYQ